MKDPNYSDFKLYGCLLLTKCLLSDQFYSKTTGNTCKSADKAMNVQHT